MQIHRRATRAVVAGFLALVLMSCGGEAFAPSPPPPPVPNASLLGGLLGGVTGTLGGTLKGVGTLAGGLTEFLLETLNLLTCPRERTVRDSEVIGHRGGTLHLGRHKLVVPRGALTHNVLISGVVVGDGTASVQLYPEGLQFQRPAELKLDYGRCSRVRGAKHIVYTTDDGEILELIRSLDDAGRSIVEGKLDHFSRYAVAW